MALKLFGFRIGREQENRNKIAKSFVPPENQDGSVLVESGGMFGTFVDLDGTIRNETELITRYRDMSIQPELDAAIRQIVNEAIVVEENQSSVSLVLDKLDYSEETKDQIRKEFDNVMNLLDFNNEGQDIFRRWYIDGRLFYHIMIDTKNPREGIQELRYIDPRKIHKVTAIDRAVTQTNVEVITDMQEYYVFNEMGVDFMTGGQGGAVISPDSIAYSHSGIIDHTSGMVLSHLHKAIKPLNQLRMMEDATVIYRMSRAPERRAFYIDVGNLPKTKAEQYLRDIMNQYRNKIVYDASTGEIRDDKKFLSMMEDYWLPRRDGNRGTEIQTLQGGANLSELADVEFFQMKLYQCLNVPLSRLKPDTGFSLGRSAEITRDELSFGTFVSAIRNDFQTLFDTLLSRQLMLKGIIAREDWNYIKQRIFYSFLKNSFFSELKNMEIMRERFNFARDLGVTEFVGTVISLETLRKTVLQQTDEDIERENRLMKIEKEKGIGATPAMDDGMGGDGGDGLDMGDGDGGDDFSDEAGGDGEDTAGEEGDEETSDTGEGGDDLESDTDPELQFSDEEKQQLAAAAKKSGLNPNTVMDTLNSLLGGGDQEYGDFTDEDKEVLIAAAKKAKVDPKPLLQALGGLTAEPEEEQPEEPQKKEESYTHPKQFRKSLEKLWK